MCIRDSYTPSLLALSSDTSICEGASATLNVDPDLQVSWSPTGGLSCDTCTTTLAAPAQTTTYVVTTELGSCLLSDSVTITVDAITPILLSNDTIVCVSDTVQLNATTDASAVNWSPADQLSCDDCFDPVCIPLTTITYLVTAQNVACPDSAFITISISLPPVSYTHLDVYKRQGPDHLHGCDPGCHLHGHQRHLLCLLYTSRTSN